MTMSLSRLWLLTVLTVSMLIYCFASCGRKMMTSVKRQPLAQKRPAVLQQPPAAEQDQSRQTYTYVGGAQRPKSARNTSSSKSTKPAALDKAVLTRKTRVDTASGDIPDLHIRLAGNSIRRVMARYGYVPAMKTRTRLLGKIERDNFVPLTEQELHAYAARGRAGDAYPAADKWRDQVAEEFGLPAQEVQCIFLVPKATEAFFIELQMQALNRTGRTRHEVALVRAHFAPDLSIIVDELVTKNGEVVKVDSVRADFVP